MKKFLIFMLVLLQALSCREKRSAFEEPLLLDFYHTTSDKYCEPDSLFPHAEKKGALLLLSNNKALYALSDADTTRFFRGTYRLIDHGIFCSFNAAFDHSPGKAQVKDKNRKNPVQPIRAWNLTLMKTGCGEIIYYSDKGNLRNTRGISKAVYLETGRDAELAFISRVNAVPELLDFHLKPLNKTKTPFLNNELIEKVLAHYQSKNSGNYMKRIDRDSLTELVFSYKKVPRGQEPGPYLYVRVSRLKSETLEGDLNGDNKADLVVLPVLSQGGNSYWKEFLVFLNTQNGMELTTLSSAYDLAQYRDASHSGKFYPEKILEGSIVGTSICYTDDDAACCPSVKVATRVQLRDNRLISIKEK